MRSAGARADLITAQFLARPFRVDKTPNKGEDESSFKSRLIEKTAKRQVKEEEEARQNGQQK